MMRVYGCQLNTVWEDKVKNFKRILALLSKRRLSRGSLLVLPEMFATGFSMRSDAIAEGENGPTSTFLKELAREQKVFVLGGLVRLAAGGQKSNEAVCFAPSGKQVARYAKLHLFSPGGESRHYSPGHGITLFRWGKFKVAVFICYDLRFPEIFRMAVQRGANVLVVIANWPGKRQTHWTALLRARAVENQAYVLGVNRCGEDPQLEYHGGSLILNPWGEILAKGGRNESVFSANLRSDAIKRIRLEFPALRDLRTRFSLE